MTQGSSAFTNASARHRSARFILSLATQITAFFSIMRTSSIYPFRILISKVPLNISLLNLFINPYISSFFCVPAGRIIKGDFFKSIKKDEVVVRSAWMAKIQYVMYLTLTVGRTFLYRSEYTRGGCKAAFLSRSKLSQEVGKSFFFIGLSFSLSYRRTFCVHTSVVCYFFPS